jgi:hypothetical protein
MSFRTDYDGGNISYSYKTHGFAERNKVRISEGLSAPRPLKIPKWSGAALIHSTADEIVQIEQRGGRWRIRENSQLAIHSLSQ